MKRPKTFDDIIGHDWHVQYFKDHIAKGTLKHFIIIEGPEGLGKTSLADLIAINLVYGLGDSPEKEEAYKTVVLKKVSNDYIKKFELSVDGGKEVAREVRSEMNATFTLGHPKVIICDECHALSPEAQDVFLAETEYISNNVYIIMLTTEVERLKASLRSRAVPIHLGPLKQADMVKVLRDEMAAQNLTIQNPEATLAMIAEWSECKPRAGLNLLNAFSSGSTVSSQMIQELIGYLDVRDIVPMLASLSGSMSFGLCYISEMAVSDSLVSLVIEILRIMSGESSYKIKAADVRYIRSELSNVKEEQLERFLYGITRHQHVCRTDVINAYISSHTNQNLLYNSDPVETLNIEQAQKSEVALEEVQATQAKAPTFADLLKTGSIVRKG